MPRSSSCCTCRKRRAVEVLVNSAGITPGSTMKGTCWSQQLQRSFLFNIGKDASGGGQGRGR